MSRLEAIDRDVFVSTVDFNREMFVSSFDSLSMDHHKVVEVACGQHHVV